MPQPGARGFFITLEGIDGCGKSTQTRLLAEQFRMLGRSVVATREPGGSPGAEEIRALLVKGHADRWLPETELLLFVAARVEHFRTVIEPALAQGKIVICDRYIDSTRVYQGVVRSDRSELVDLLHLRLGIEPPDLTVLLDIDPNVACSRQDEKQSNETRFESFGVEFQRSLRQAFLDLADSHPERFEVVNAACAPDALSKRILELSRQRCSAS